MFFLEISENWLETVIPKVRGGRMMIVSGNRRGSIAVLEAKDKKKHKVLARIIATGEIVSMSFDEVCEYLGSTDDF